MDNLIPKLTIGRIVHYVLSAEDCQGLAAFIVQQGDSAMFAGNPPQPGDVVPAIVVVPWSDTMFNGQAFLDGNQAVWLTSVSLDQDEKKPGTWHWPEFAPVEKPEPTTASDYGKPFGEDH